MVVGTGEVHRYLKRTLPDMAALVDEVVVACNATDKATRKYLAEFQQATAYDMTKYEWGREQWKIKDICYRKFITPRRPDWVLCLDSDELLDQRIARSGLEELASRNEIAFTFWCIQLWNDDKHMRVDGGWGNFRNVRFYKHIPEADPSFQRTPLHCGLAPKYAYNWAADSEFVFEHYGYMKAADRERKIARYQKYDPKALYHTKEWYDSIGQPGHIVEYDREAFPSNLHYTPKQIPIEKVIKQKTDMKTYMVRNPHDRLVSMDEAGVFTIFEKNKDGGVGVPKRGKEGYALVGAEDIIPKKEIPIVDTLEPIEEENAAKPETFSCAICGFEAKSAGGLSSHAKTHQ